MNERFMRPIHKINVPKVLLAKKFNFADKFLRYCAKNVSTCAKFCEDAPLLTEYIFLLGWQWSYHSVIQLKFNEFTA